MPVLPPNARRARFARLAVLTGAAALALGLVVATGGLRALDAESGLRRLCATQYAAARTARDSAAVDSLTVQGSRGFAPGRTCGATRATQAPRTIRVIAAPAAGAPAP